MPDRIGRYSLVRRLGQGAMGDVWEAVLEGPEGFRKPVALKQLRHGPEASDDRKALLHEARLGALLHHPNVVGVHALEPHEGGWMVVMELVRGASVSQLVRERPLPPRALLELGTQAARGLLHIHELQVDGRHVGLVHRDIKPGNLLVDQTGLVKVADLGVAALAGETTIVGTPGFMAPEQYEGTVDARTDLFGLGVTLFVCATRSLPFGRERMPPTRMRRALHGPLLESVEACVPGLGPVLGALLAPSADARPRSAAQLLDALESLRLPRTSPGLRSVLHHARPDLDLTAPGSSPASTGRTERHTVGNLRPLRDAFVGRTEDVEALAQRLRDGERLITLLGPGGMGKTRLAREVAARLQGEVSGGAWFVDLSEAHTPAGVCFATAQALGVPLDPAGDPVAQLGWALSGRGGPLLVLDNLEQCQLAAAEVIGRWLDSAEDARLLCTSRIRLEVRGESVVPVQPLEVDAAARLFLERAPSPVPTEHHEAVRELVAAIDGLPLAIELAAARTRLLPVPALLERLGPGLLAGGGADRPERHRSLHACLTASWDLLDPDGRRALAQLAVFDGSFDLRAAEAVLDLPPDAGWALDVLARLSDASLVQVHPDSGRFSLLSSVRAFAAEALGVEAPGATRRHGAWFAQLRDEATPADLDNLVAACTDALDRDDGEVAAGAALGAWRVLSRTGPTATGLALLERAAPIAPARLRGEVAAHRALALMAAGRTEEAVDLALGALETSTADATAASRARLHLAVARGSFALARPEACDEHARQALVLARAAGARVLEATALSALGLFALETGRSTQAPALYEQALEVLRDTDDREELARTLGQVGTMRQFMGELDEAREVLLRALGLLRQLGDRRYEAVTRANLGIVARQQGRLDDARRQLEAALAADRRVGNRPHEALCHTNLGNLHFQQDQLTRASARYEAAVAVAEEVGDQRVLCVALGNLAQVRRKLGDTDGAETCLTRAVDIARERRDPRMHGHLLGQLATTRVAHDPDAALALLDQAEALARQGGDPGLRAGVQIERARVLALAGHPSRAHEVLEDVVATLPPERADLPELVAEVRAVIEDARTR